MTREEQVKEYRKKHFQINLNYEQHLLLRWLIETARNDVREDKFNLDDLAEQIYECRIMGPNKWTYSTEELNPKRLPLDPNHSPLNLELEPRKEIQGRFKINKGPIFVAVALIIVLTSGLTFLTMKALQKRDEGKAISRHIPVDILQNKERKQNEILQN
jgi:hypothetical protein